MHEDRSEQSMLPHLDDISIPCVNRKRIDTWKRQARSTRLEDARSFGQAWRDGGLAAVKAHPWWDVLSNLSVARFAIEEDDG